MCKCGFVCMCYSNDVSSRFLLFLGRIRVAVVIVFAVASLVIVALAHKTWLSLIGK